MNVTTARKAAVGVVDEIEAVLTRPLLYGERLACVALIGRAIRREAIAYHKRALQAARSRAR